MARHDRIRIGSIALGATLLAGKSCNSLYMIDSTIVRTHRSASGEKGGAGTRYRAAHAAVT